MKRKAKGLKFEKDKLLKMTDENDNESASMYENCANKVRPRRRKGKEKIAEHEGNGSERDEKEEDNLLESISKGDDELTSFSENSANKVRPRHRKGKIDFSLLRLDEE